MLILSVLEEIMKKFAYVFVFLVVLTLVPMLFACDESSPSKPPVLSQTIEGMDDFNYFANDNAVLLLSPKDINAKSLTVPACVTSISDGAFEGCNALEEVKFEKNSKLAEVKACAFRNCISLKNIQLPSSVKKIGNRAFSGCVALEKAEYNASGIKEFGTAVFENCKNLKSVVVPSVVSEVTNKDFAGCDALEEVTFLDGVTKIGNDAFNGKPIGRIVLSQTLQSIGDRAFKGNKLSGLISFPESLTSIGNEAFSGHGFAGIGLPWTVTSIGQNAFSCGEKANLEYLIVPFAGKTKNSGNLIDVFSENGLSNLKQLYINGGTINGASLKGLGNVGLFASGEVEIEAGSLDETQWYKSQPDGIVYIGEILYGYKGSISQSYALLKIKEGTTKILDYAFANAKISDFGEAEILGGGGYMKFGGYLAVELPSTLKSIGKQVFCATMFAGVSVSETNTTFKAENACLLTKDGKKLIYGSLHADIPDNIETIGEFAFVGYQKDVITIPQSVKTIGKGAFYVSQSKRVIIPKKVETIDKFAFAGVERLGTVEFEEGSELKTIADYAFATYGLTSSATLDLSVLSQLKKVGNYAFSVKDSYFEEKIKTVILPNNLTELEVGICPFGSKLETIEISEDNKNYTLIDNCLIKGNTVVFGTRLSIIPAEYEYTDANNNTSKIKINKIGKCAFAGADISTVEIPSSVEIIEESAFEGCTGKTSLALHKGLTTIGNRAFANVALTDISFGTDSELKQIGDEAFSGAAIKQLSIPSTVKNIGNRAFANVALTDISFGTDSELKQIGDEAFSGATIKQLSIPSTVKTIGRKAFASAHLEKLTFETRIEKGHRVYDLQNVGDTAFSNSLSLQHLVAPAGVIAKIKGSVADVQNIEIVGEDDIEAGLLAKTRVSSLSIGEGVKKIGDRAFEGLEITSLTIPASVIEIGVGAFWHCPIETLAVAEGNTEYFVKNNCLIDKTTHTLVAAFDNGTISKDFVWGGSDGKTKIFDVTSIGYGAFAFAKIESMVIPSNVKTIGEFAFAHSALKQVVIESGVKNIGAKAFYMSGNLQTVSVADSVQSIGRNAFEGTKYYADKENENGIVYIGKVAYVYRGNKADITDIEIKDGTVGIADHALGYMRNLKTITLPSSVKHIDSMAFLGCTNLKNIYYNGTDDGWNAIVKAKNWDLNTPIYKVWTKCPCLDKTHDHDGDGTIKGENEEADKCGNYKLRGADMCDECFGKDVDKVVSENKKK